MPCLRENTGVSLCLVSKNSCVQGVPVVARWIKNTTGIYKEAGSIPGLAQWVMDLALLWLRHKSQTWLWLWCGSQTRLRSDVAVAVV